MSEPNGIKTLPFAIAHRGGNELHHENSLAAFADALTLGYQRLETDVHVDADGNLLAVHGQTPEGVDGGDYLLVNEEVISISGLTVNTRNALQTDGIYIPTLNDLLDMSDDAHWNIDAKTPTAVGPLLKTLETRKAFARVCLGSFDQGSIEQLRARAPSGTQTSLVEAELINLYMASLTPGGIAELPPHARAQVPTMFSGIPVTTSSFIETAHRHNIPVEAWTINDGKEMSELIELGIDGIFTDKVRILKSVLSDRDMWQE